MGLSMTKDELCHFLTHRDMMITGMAKCLMGNFYEVQEPSVAEVEAALKSSTAKGGVTASELIIEMAEVAGVKIRKQPPPPMKQNPAQERDQSHGTGRASPIVNRNFQDRIYAMAKLAHKEGTRIFGEDEFEAQIKEVKSHHEHADPDDYHRAMMALSVKEQESAEVKPTKAELLYAMTERLGAPKLQVQCIVATEAAINHTGLTPDGQNLQLVSTIALCIVNNWLKEGRSPSTMVLSGSPGIGKTTAATLALYWDVMDFKGQGRSQCFYSALKLARLSASLSSQHDEVIKSLYNARTLVIDNLPEQKYLPSHTQSTLIGLLQEVLDHRQNCGLSTIITTTLKAGRVKADYGDVVYSHFSSPRGIWHELRDVTIPKEAIPRLANLSSTKLLR